MLYHLKIELKTLNPKTKKREEILAKDIESKDVLMKSFVQPYIKGKAFSVDGFRISSSDILRFCIKESSTDLQTIVNHKQNQVPDNVFFFVTEAGAFEDDNYLKEITNQLLEEAEAEDTAIHPKKPPKSIKSNNKIFVVHGHDEAMKLAVDAFVRKIKLEPIILSEQPNLGSTIIDKIEANSNVGYAIILYSPCDVGARKGDAENLKDRARQNVVFEHGYFIAKLGRQRVAAIIKDSVEYPSDISGMVYTNFDAAGGWKLKIMQELNALGYIVNANDLLLP